jgi:small subunit ribosomal protein S1
MQLQHETATKHNESVDRPDFVNIISSKEKFTLFSRPFLSARSWEGSIEVIMSREQTNTVKLEPENDAYWSALFLQEEILATSPPSTGETQFLENLIPSSNGNSIENSPTWRLATDALRSDSTLRLPVTGYNKGGLLVSWQDLQGFVPASQLVNFPLLHVAHERLKVLANLQNKTLDLKIIEVNPYKNRLVLSERAALVKAEEKVNLLHRIRPNDILTGHVTNLTNFGAFVDLGGVEGLIHISELSWSRVTHPSQIVQPGQTIRVTVLNVDRERERIGLSHKRLKRDPWHAVEERYKTGDLVTGQVTNIVSFGVFVQLEEELEGLIHISELAEGSFLHPRNVVKQGQHVQARVLKVNGQKKRLALSLRGLNIS